MMIRSRRIVLSAALALCCGFAATSAAHAQAWPNKPIRVMVGFAAGGNGDITTRIIGAKMSNTLGQTLVVVNRPGAAGNIAAVETVKSAPDGYTIMMMPSVTPLNSLFNRNMGFDLARDLVPIGGMTSTALVLAVPIGMPVRSVREFVDHARRSARPMAYGSGGLGSGSHLAAELLAIKTGLKFTHVPYKGGASAITDVMGGVTDLFFDTLVSSAALVNSGKIKVLAVTTAERSSLLPDVPTLTAEGYPDFSDVSVWIGLSAPRGTDPQIIATLNRHLNQALADPEVKQKLIGIGAVGLPTTPERFGDIVKAEVDRWAGVIKAANIKTE